VKFGLLAQSHLVPRPICRTCINRHTPNLFGTTPLGAYWSRRACFEIRRAPNQPDLLTGKVGIPSPLTRSRRSRSLRDFLDFHLKHSAIIYQAEIFSRFRSRIRVAIVIVPYSWVVRQTSSEKESRSPCTNTVQKLESTFLCDHSPRTWRTPTGIAQSGGAIGAQCWVCATSCRSFLAVDSTAFTSAKISTLCHDDTATDSPGWYVTSIAHPCSCAVILE
jgi:hypothetical protein